MFAQLENPKRKPLGVFAQLEKSIPGMLKSSTLWQGQGAQRLECLQILKSATAKVSEGVFPSVGKRKHSDTFAVAVFRICKHSSRWAT